MPGRIKSSMGRHMRRTFIAGALLLIPVALTYVILVFIYDLVNGVLQPGMEWLAEQIGRKGWTFPGVGLVTAVILIYLAGIVAARGLGITLVRWTQETVVDYASASTSDREIIHEICLTIHF
mgnify:CR=1 FL=1